MQKTNIDSLLSTPAGKSEKKQYDCYLVPSCEQWELRWKQIWFIVFTVMQFSVSRVTQGLLFITITSPSHHHLTCKFLLYLYLQYESSAFSTNFYKKQIRKTN